MPPGFLTPHDLGQNKNFIPSMADDQVGFGIRRGARDMCNKSWMLRRESEVVMGIEIGGCLSKSGSGGKLVIRDWSA